MTCPRICSWFTVGPGTIYHGYQVLVQTFLCYISIAPKRACGPVSLGSLRPRSTWGFSGLQGASLTLLSLSTSQALGSETPGFAGLRRVALFMTVHGKDRL